MNKNAVLVLAVVFILIILGAIFFSGGKSNIAENNLDIAISPAVTITTAPSASISATITPKESSKTSSGSALGMETTNELKIEDLTVGTGAEATAGKKVTVNYKGTLTNGTQFDSSYDRGEPFSFNLGEGDVIEGWDKGFAGMKVGGKRKLTIPSDMAYGARALPGIPANSALVFEVELLKVE